VLLGVETDNERRDVDDLLADADVALLDEDTGVMDRLGETELVDLGLEPSFQEIFVLQGEHVIELHAAFVQDTDTNQTANQGVAFEEALGVFLVQGEKLTGSTTDLREGQTDAPDFTFVAETIFTNGLQFLIETSRLERTTGDFVGFRVTPGGHFVVMSILPEFGVWL